ncbi:copper homeostasis protein CutC [Nocardioides dubius]|uniref:Copper homeostasis protein cutC homolog n=1 Tax=Nocardioides dubius TaxID=317019 RepID=A0ABP4EJ78_9ACTN
MSLLLEVEVRQVRDVVGAVEGGADRLLLTTATGLSPDLKQTLAVIRESSVPVRVVLRLNDSRTTTGGEFARLSGLIGEYVALGAEGVMFGFLDAELGIDLQVCGGLAEANPGVPWTFSDAIDDCLETSRAWRELRQLPGCDAVFASGSPRGLGVGYDELLELAQADPAAAAVLLPGRGLVAEQVPWLVRAGVRQFHVGVQARPSGSYRADVDAGHVRSWRLLLDGVR